MKYYIVTTKCGHVGKSKYILIDFPIAAEDGETAASIARKIPRVKHNHKDAIRNVKQVDYDTYYEKYISNHNDEYLKCSSKQEQSLNCNLEGRLYDEIKIEHKNERSNDKRWFHKTCVRNYRKYLLNYLGV